MAVHKEKIFSKFNSIECKCIICGRRSRKGEKCSSCRNKEGDRNGENHAKRLRREKELANLSGNRSKKPD